MGSAVAAGMRNLVRSVEELNIPAAGHYPATQAPREFATAVTTFLAALSVKTDNGLRQ
jgi:pimeloyl-ACP methyl ester carboxylesterase